MPVRRAQDETAAKLKRSELPPRGMRDVESRDRSGRNLDRNRRFRRHEHLRAAHEERRKNDAGKKHVDALSAGKDEAPRAGPQAPILRFDDGSVIASSSNSSASFSVIAPPSSSASTMVTARR